MRLALDVPRNWQWRDAPGRDLYVVSPEPWLSIEVGPLVEAPELPSGLIARGLGPGQSLTGLRELAHHTDTGWPLHLQDALICDPAGAVVQVRLLATYSFLLYATVVFCHAATVEILELHRAAIVATLEGARPILHRRSPAAIAELWSMEDAP